MSVLTYSLKNDGDKYISSNFKIREFRCKDGSDRIKLSPQTIEVLEALRNWFGRPVHINSAYRTPKYNRKIGGASRSRHVVGDACDIRIDGVPPAAIVAYIERFYPKHGVGLYSTFVHIDSRGYRVYWKNKGSNVVNSFYKGNKYLNYRKINAPQTTTLEREDMTQAEFNQMMNVYLNEIASEPANAEWSKDSIRWAIENGLIKGDQHGNLKMHSYVTREQIAAILNRYNNLNIETDGKLSNWSLEARTWAVENKLVQGDGNKYGWLKRLTLETFITVLHRFYKLIKK